MRSRVKPCKSAHYFFIKVNFHVVCWIWNKIATWKVFLLLKIKTLETGMDPRLFLELTSMPGWLSTFAYKTLSLMYMCGYFASPYE